jgi:Cu(I)/Ag(I) efflux system membrane fusion protein
MNEGFVIWDSTIVNANASRLISSLDSLKTDELKNDTAVYQTVISTINMVKTEATGILSENSWKEKRGSLNVLSQNFYDLLRTVQYDVDRIYYQECPMAFGEDTYGYWVSTKKAIRNPYLGTSDPEWGRKMLACGSTRDSLKFYDKKANP